eukprot:9499161-Pyramimonas_sp.AAC.1
MGTQRNLTMTDGNTTLEYCELQQGNYSDETTPHGNSLGAHESRRHRRQTMVMMPRRRDGRARPVRQPRPLEPVGCSRTVGPVAPVRPVGQVRPAGPVRPLGPARP